MRNIKMIILLFLMSFASICKTEVTYHSKSDSNIYMTMSNGIFEVYCMSKSLDELNFQPHKWITNFTQAFIVNCKPPNTSYMTAMKQIQVNLDGIEQLHLHIAHIPNVVHFEDLNIEELVVSNSFGPVSLQLALDILEPLTNLTKLEVNMFDLLPFQDVKGVTKLSLKRGKSLGAIGECNELQNLEMVKWRLNLIPEQWLVNCSQLTSIMIENLRNFSKEDFQRVIEGTSSLKELVVTDTGLKEFPKDLFHFVTNLTKLDLSSNKMGSNISLSDIHLESLSYLNFGYCDIDRLLGLPVSEAPTMEIDIRGNKIRDWQINHSEYEKLKHKVSTLVYSDNHGVSMACDCQHALLATAVREGHLNMTSEVECSGGESITDIDRDIVECTMYQCKNSTCTCRRHWSDNKVVAHCTNATRVPRERGLYALHAAGNDIVTLSPDDLPPTLVKLDIRRNRLTNIDTDTLKVLFNVTERIVYLAGNPLECECENQPMIESLKANSIQVEDYTNITCFGDERPIINLDVAELCSWNRQVVRTVVIAVCAVLLGLIAISSALFCRYRQQVKVFLYSRGCCLRWLREEEIDSDRIYDAFLSFSHGDEAFVVEKLIPTLDSEYKLCLHFRDWVVGDFIPAQITRSVERSRRTVIVLSRNFVESVWGLLEFRTAYMSAVQEGRARIIIIVIDDVVDDEDLESELRSYVRNNTYVRWGDKWFWEKLHYAMPHSRIPASQPYPTHATDIDMAFPVIAIGPGMEMAALPAPPEPYIIMPA